MTHLVSNENIDEIIRSLKSILIVGETIDNYHTYQEYQIYNIISAMTLIVGAFISMYQAFISNYYWIGVFIIFLMLGFYFLLDYKITIYYAITKFRIIKIEHNLLNRYFLKNTPLAGLSDLHYQHIESINLSGPKIRFNRFYAAIIFVVLGIISFRINLFIYQWVAIILIFISIINFGSSLPIGGIRLIIRSVSGEKLEFSETKTPSEFIDELLIHSRTFISYTYSG